VDVRISSGGSTTVDWVIAAIVAAAAAGVDASGSSAVAFAAAAASGVGGVVTFLAASVVAAAGVVVFCSPPCCLAAPASLSLPILTAPLPMRAPATIAPRTTAISKNTASLHISPLFFFCFFDSWTLGTSGDFWLFLLFADAFFDDGG
ncbi:hypothetical protein PFISCL1PPCAC_22826, partial [Pristionchus fissidentatus]